MVTIDIAIGLPKHYELVAVLESYCLSFGRCICNGVSGLGVRDNDDDCTKLDCFSGGRVNIDQGR